MLAIPDRTEAAEYYFTYIDQVPAGDLRDILERQREEVLAYFGTISEAQSLSRYAPDKWSLREVLGHINDTERLFTFRALWFARGLEPPLPSFDQNVAVAGSAADSRPWQSHVDEFRQLRGASIALFRNMPEEAWTRRGIASGNPMSVRALAYMTAGHVEHHVAIVRKKYLPA
jgi:hypothetical protein